MAYLRPQRVFKVVLFPDITVLHSLVRLVVLLAKERHD